MANAVLSEAGRPAVKGQVRVPALRPEPIPRTRLARLQTIAQGSRLVLVCAPAGYGKSTLVAQWSDADPRPGCRVQLDRGDNDPVRLLTRLVAALESTGPVDPQLLAELSRAAPRIEKVALPVLAADVARRDPFVLVLDDVHEITAEMSRAILAFLVAELPARSQLVLVTRGDPGVSLARLRAGGDLVEVGAELLALDPQETRDVAASGGLELSDDAAEALCLRTEGWAAAVVLAALWLSGREDGAARAAGLRGDQTQIADYLVEEVLDRQPEDLKRFLLGTSVLDRLTGPLCDAVLGTTGAAASLETLARSNAFVVSTDDHRAWYRYHRLFADLLRTELARRDPEMLTVYRRRAAQWCEQYGDPEFAFAYAHESGELAQAGRIALAHRDEFAMRGQSQGVRLWLDRCTDDEIASEPQLSLAAAWVLSYGGEATRARRFIAAAERGRLDEPSPDGAFSLRSSLASLRTILAPDGIPQMLVDAEFAYESEKAADTRWRASGGRAKGVAYVLLGRPQEAIAVLREALGLLSDQPELAHVRVSCLAYLVFAAAEMNNPRDVQRWAAEATWLVGEARLEETIGSAGAHTAGALAQQQRGDYTEAARQLDSVKRSRRRLGAVPWLDADLALRCAGISLDLGDHGGALELAELARDALEGYPDGGTLPDRLRQLEKRIGRGEDYGLTSAELRVLGFLPTHLSLQEIGGRLYLARPTVKTHVASIYDKLGVTGRSEAVEKMEECGIGSRYPHAATPDLGPGS